MFRQFSSKILISAVVLVVGCANFSVVKDYPVQQELDIVKKQGRYETINRQTDIDLT